MKEIWKSVKGYEDYEVSNLGRIKSRKRTKEKVLSQNTDRYGYRAIRIYKDGEGKTFTVHRIVALAFLENPFNKPTINHKDGIKTNNNADNLEWTSTQENTLHACVNGLIKKNKPRKLSEKQVEEIKSKYVPRKYSTIRLSEEYGVSQYYIWRIVNGIAFKEQSENELISKYQRSSRNNTDIKTRNAEIIKLKKEGVDVKTLSEIYGISQGSIYNCLKKEV